MISSRSSTPNPEAIDYFFTIPDDAAATIRYRVLGRGLPGRPLVMVTGMGSLLEDWGPIPAAIAKKQSRQVLIFDNRGIGGSTLAGGHGKLTIARFYT